LAAGVVGHVAGSVVLVVGAGGGVNPVPGVGGHTHVFGAAFCDRLLQPVAPGVVTIAVSPVFGLAVDSMLGAIGADSLGRDEPVQRVVGEGLVTAVIAIVGNAEDIAVISVAQVEVIADGEDALRRRRGGHEHLLQALVVTEAVGDAHETRALAADEA